MQTISCRTNAVGSKGEQKVGGNPNVELKSHIERDFENKLAIQAYDLLAQLE
jgi:hypothetical protein